MAEGHDESSAWAICRSRLNMAAACPECGCEDPMKMAKDCKPGMECMSCHGKAMKEGGKPERMDMAALQTRDILGVEVFGIGEWNGNPISSRDLDTIVESFKATWQRLKPAVWLGHDRGQPILRNTGLPAAGWVENLRRAGDKLLADFKRVPAKVADLIDAGAYRRVSVGLIGKYRMGDSVYDLALQHIGLLGAMTPAVDNLDDIIAQYGLLSYAESQQPTEYQYQPGTPAGSEDMTEIEKLKQEVAEAQANFAKADAELRKLKGEDMEGLKSRLADAERARDEATARFSASEARVKELEGQVASEKARADKAEGEVREYKAKARSQQIEAKVDEYIRKGKLAPAQKAAAVALLEGGLSAGELEFASGDKTLKSAEDILFALIELNPGVTLSEGGQTGAGTAKRGARDGEVGMELDDKAKKYAADNKVSYKEALLAVSRGAGK